VDPIEALERIAYLLETGLAPSYRVKAFRHAADAVRPFSREDLRERAASGQLRSLPGIGPRTEEVIRESLQDVIPSYLRRLESEVAEGQGAEGSELRSLLKGDCHTHSDWSDGGSPIDTMARAALQLGHDYMVLTDHSPTLKVANGLSPDRLRRQLAVVAQINEEMAPFRILTGIEVDILEDGSLDQEEGLLARLDVVVGSVHSKLRMDSVAMTRRMLAALANPHVDILGHCTGRILTGRRGRPESTFDAQAVFSAAVERDKAIEINCRPERLDPPKRLLRLAVQAGCKVAIDSDAHAPGQLEWQPYGCRRAALCEVPTASVVNTWPAEQLLGWTASHR
jgi:putative hydrolase